MAVKPIVTIPNDILNKPCAKVRELDAQTLADIKDLKDTLNVATDPEGAGLAANQLGINKRMCVVRYFHEDPTAKGKAAFEEFVLVNPKVVSTSKETDIEWEGCLSVPDTYGRVSRFKKIKLTATDETGEAFKMKAEGYFARTIQHEIDHLDGVLFTQRVIGETISEADLDKLFDEETTK